MNDGSTELSVIIVCWNTRDILRNCLNSVFAETKNTNFEVIVVDNASTDGSPEMVSVEFPSVRLIRNSINSGFASANNIGIRAARGAFILLLNSDTIILDHAIDKSLFYIKNHPKCGVLGCKAVYPDRTFQSSYYRNHNLADLFMTRLLPFDLVKGNRLNRSRYWGRIFTEPKEVEVVAGCFFLLRKQVVLDAGLLDEDFFMYGEEEEWCFRIRRSGWHIEYVPLAQIIHIHGFSAAKAHKVMNLITRKSPLLVLDKTHGLICAWFGNFFMGTGAMLRFPVWIAVDIFKGRKAHTISSLVKGRYNIMTFHIKGLFRPVWRQGLPGEHRSA